MLLLHLTVANLKMIVRNRQAMFWSMAFPLIFVLVFGVFFRDRDSSTTIAVVDYARDDMSAQLIAGLRQMPGFAVELRDDEQQARQEIRGGDLGYLLVLPPGLRESAATSPPASITLVYDDSSPASGVVAGAVQSFVDRLNLEMAGASSRLSLAAEGVVSSDVSYLEFLLPGLAIWGVMSYSVIGLATVMASYRENNVLRRILATPLNVRVFFAAKVLAYLGLALVQAAIIFAVGSLFFGVDIEGNIIYIGLLVLIGNLVFLNLGFIVGSFSKSVQAASGLGNAVVLPLMFFSGVFFPTDGLPKFLQLAVDYLPLAPMLQAVRGVTLEARPFWDYPTQLAVLAAWIAVTALFAVKTFRFR